MILAFGLVTLAGCGIADKVKEAQTAAATAQDEYAALDLTCNFDDITANSEATAAAGASLDDAASASSACDAAADQYAIMVANYDSDGDGKLSDSEEAEAKTDFDAEVKKELDANGDGTVSDDEKAQWREKKLPDVKAKRDDQLSKSCAALNKPVPECRGLRGEHKGEVKQALDKRVTEFDKNGDGKLDDAERKAMNDALATERGKREDDFKKQHGEQDRQQRRDDRQKGRQGKGGAPAPGGAPSTQPQVGEGQPPQGPQGQGEGGPQPGQPIVP
jgi:hypothetical protein